MHNGFCCTEQLDRFNFFCVRWLVGVCVCACGYLFEVATSRLGKRLLLGQRLRAVRRFCSVVDKLEFVLKYYTRNDGKKWFPVCVCAHKNEAF